jgi:hypothetical protein
MSIDLLSREVLITYNVRHHNGDDVHLLAMAAQARLGGERLDDELWSRLESAVTAVVEELARGAGLATSRDGDETPLEDWDRGSRPDPETEL